MENVSQVYRLQNPTLNDSVRVFMWALSANNHAKVANSRIQVGYTEFPFVFHERQVEPTLQEYADALHYYVNGFKLGS